MCIRVLCVAILQMGGDDVGDTPAHPSPARELLSGAKRHAKAMSVRVSVPGNTTSQSQNKPSLKPPVLQGESEGGFQHHSITFTRVRDS